MFDEYVKNAIKNRLQLKAGQRVRLRAMPDEGIEEETGEVCDDYDLFSKNESIIVRVDEPVDEHDVDCLREVTVDQVELL